MRMPQMKNIVSVLSPLKPGECLSVQSEVSDRFAGTIHYQEDYELHLIEGAAGAKRIVGDRITTIGDAELVLIAQSNLPHAWMRGRCAKGSHTVIEVHFREELFAGIADKLCFDGIRHLLELAASGLVFSPAMTARIRQDLIYLSATQDKLQQYTLFLNILNRLTEDTAAERIVGPGYVWDRDSQDSQSIATVKDYIFAHYNEEIYLKTLADLVGVEEQWLSARFKYKTGNTINDYINQVRLSHVARRLMNTEDPVATIANECGFPNLANFNRHFKRIKGTTPVAFRREYRTAKI